jgi:hypothetical protein
MYTVTVTTRNDCTNVVEDVVAVGEEGDFLYLYRGDSKYSPRVGFNKNFVSYFSVEEA